MVNLRNRVIALSIVGLALGSCSDNRPEVISYEKFAEMEDFNSYSDRLTKSEREIKFVIDFWYDKLQKRPYNKDELFALIPDTHQNINEYMALNGLYSREDTEVRMNGDVMYFGIKNYPYDQQDQQ